MDAGGGPAGVAHGVDDEAGAADGIATGEDAGDAGHLVAVDDEALDALDLAAVSYQIILTKADKLHPTKIEPLVNATLEKIRKRPAAFPDVIATSSEKHEGLEIVHAAILKAIDSSPVTPSQA